MRKLIAVLVLVTFTGCSFTIKGPPSMNPPPPDWDGKLRCDSSADGRTLLDLVGGVATGGVGLLGVDYALFGEIGNDSSPDDSGIRIGLMLASLVSLSLSALYWVAIGRGAKTMRRCQAAKRRGEKAEKGN